MKIANAWHLPMEAVHVSLLTFPVSGASAACAARCEVDKAEMVRRVASISYTIDE